MSTYSVFTYGTLQIPAVMQAVTGKKLTPASAILNGYQRFKIKQRTYPGLIKNEACFVEGMLYHGIDDRSLELLDLFEDVMYERCLLDVQVDEEIKSAFVYVTKSEYRECLSDKEWSMEEFKTKYLSFYLRDISKL